MSKYQNMKIEINKYQPLDEVVRELERLGYKKEFESGSKQFIRTVSTCNGGLYGTYSYEAWVYCTTLTQLKAMED